MRLGRGGAALGGGGLLVAIVMSLLFGGDMFSGGEATFDDPYAGTGGSGRAPIGTPQEEELKEFASVVLADTEETWPELLASEGVRYRAPKMVLYSDAAESGCGYAESAVGPFYCPRDQKVYLDLTFFNELSQKYGAPGDFAAAYVIAHEIGHHVQNQLGISGKVQAAEARSSKRDANALSVRLELQADCFAGIWANKAQRERQMLQRGDIEEGLRAAAAVGDDTLQRRSRGHVVPESFTHGSAEQRMQWFQKGFETGSMEACNTFTK